MRSDDIFGRDFIDIVCRLLKVLAPVFGNKTTKEDMLV